MLGYHHDHLRGLFLKISPPIFPEAKTRLVSEGIQMMWAGHFEGCELVGIDG